MCDVAFAFHIESGSFDGTARSMVSTWQSLSMRPGQWQMGIGQLLLTSTNAPMINRLKLWAFGKMVLAQGLGDEDRLLRHDALAAEFAGVHIDRPQQ